MRLVAITTMRNEAPFILEWVAYHQEIGVTDFLIFSNDCEDGTHQMLDRLAALGHVHHERNRAGGKKSVQWRALSKARNHPAVKGAEWIYVTDVDEFLCIHVGDGRIADLIAACPDAEGFALPWRMFGNAGLRDFVDAPVLTQFTQAAPERLLWPWRAVQFKSLYRSDPCYDRLGVHRPKLVEGAEWGHWIDGNGRRLPDIPGTIHLTTAPRYGLAQINHYALGSMESFLVKVARGKPNHESDPIDLAYWSDRNLNIVEDRRILRHQAAVAARVETLKSDPEIAELHEEGVAWRKARIAELMTHSDSFYLFARLQQMPDTRVLPMSQQRALLQGLGVMRTAEKARKEEG
ncbi:glycosyltransferase family 2 protein [Cognatiyoonia sp. IB215182]|uniref:glycosyltransferase family 2 protein n=1 Tax=Cognatiyoonia sp. IB215182 TaxID=3097353 RepID=UPI002A11E8FE|nr:glycosyltransferase family 2 protein [Cognatiyoonia sp. IB215182]MDX8353651.1 glycosyltransferase family 2 protein [Cognatiyoonia sp. IB215182]